MTTMAFIPPVAIPWKLPVTGFHVLAQVLILPVFVPLVFAGHPSGGSDTQSCCECADDLNCQRGPVLVNRDHVCIGCDGKLRAWCGVAQAG